MPARELEVKEICVGLLVSYDPALPSCFIGDFNCVLGAHKKRGGGAPN